MKHLTTSMLGILCLALAACASETGAVQTTSATLPPPNAQGEYTVPWPTFGHGEARFITIQLGPDTYAYCRNVSPKFPFDQSVTYVQYRDQLQALASCLKHPAMEGRHVVLVGRADSRGPDDYNIKLGARRADAIRKILIESGVPADRIETVSYGARGARGMLPSYSDGYDRRVDVVVTGGTHQP